MAGNPAYGNLVLDPHAAPTTWWIPLERTDEAAETPHWAVAVEVSPRELVFLLHQIANVRENQSPDGPRLQSVSWSGLASVRLLGPVGSGLARPAGAATGAWKQVAEEERPVVADASLLALMVHAPKADRHTAHVHAHSVFWSLWDETYGVGLETDELRAEALLCALMPAISAPDRPRLLDDLMEMSPRAAMEILEAHPEWLADVPRAFFGPCLHSPDDDLRARAFALVTRQGGPTPVGAQPARPRRVRQSRRR